MNTMSEKNGYAETMTLALLHYSSDKYNHAIISMAENKDFITIGEIMLKLKLSSMPTNRRVNQLVEVGIFKRKAKKTKIYLTQLGMYYLEKFVQIHQAVLEKIVIKEVLHIEG